MYMYVQYTHIIDKCTLTITDYYMNIYDCTQMNSTCCILYTELIYVMYFTVYTCTIVNSVFVKVKGHRSLMESVVLGIHVHVSAPVFTPQKLCMYIGCAVLLCLVCWFDLACFFLSSFSSLI